MTYRFMLAVLSSLALVSLAKAQQADTTPASPPQVQFVQPASTIAEAMERREETKAAAREELAKAEAKYLAGTEAADKQLIGDLKQLAKKAAANGDIAEAAKAWEIVIEVEASDADAAEFFKAIGRPEINLEARKKANSGNGIELKKLRKSDLVNKSAKLLWKSTAWKFLPNGQVFNEEHGKVMDNAAFWTLEGGKLKIWYVDRTTLSIEFMAVNTPSGVVLIGSPAHLLTFN
jgi:hypothetical protein